MLEKKSKSIFIISCLISILIIISALAGIYGNETYIRETPDLKAQSIAQDKFDLYIIVPLLIFSGILTYFKKPNWLFIFGSCVLILIYNFTIYCFAVHFNSLFLIYCAILGLSFYSFIYVFYKSWSHYKNHLQDLHLPVKSLRAFLIILTCVFSFLWLREDITSTLLSVPSVTLTEAGLFTNPVHVLDLAIFLPGFCIVAYLLKKDNSLGKLLIPYILGFCFLMFMNIAALLVLMNTNKTGGLPPVSIFMILPSLITIFLLTVTFRRFNTIQSAD